MTRVAVSRSLASAIRDLIAAFPDDVGQSAYVARHGALPLYPGWTATIGIKPDGEIVEWSTDGDFEGLRPVDDPLWVISALVQGSKTYPALAALIPPRPPTAHMCPNCHGTGRIRVPGLAENVAENLVCSCGGVGWVEPRGRERRSLLSRLRDWLACRVG